MFKMIINEDFFDDETIDTINDEVEDLSVFENKLKITNCISINPYKYRAIGGIYAKKYFMRINAILQNLFCFIAEDNMKVEFSIHTAFEAGRKFKNGELIYPDYREIDWRHMTDNDIDNKFLWPMIENFMNKFLGPDWVEDKQFSAPTVFLETVFSIDFEYGKKFVYELFCKDISNIVDGIMSYSHMMDGIVCSSPKDNNENYIKVLNKDVVLLEFGKYDLPMSMWNYKTLNVMYNRLLSNDDEQRDMNSDKKPIITGNMILQLFKICHNLQEKDNGDFVYKLYGYLDNGGMSIDIFIELKTTNPDKLTCKDFYDFIKNNICNKLNHHAKQEIVGHVGSKNISIYILVGNQKPAIDKNNKVSQKFIEEINNMQRINWNFVMLNNRFGRLNRRYTAAIPEQMINCSNAYSNYKDDLEAGYYGKTSKEKYSRKNDIK